MKTPKREYYFYDSGINPDNGAIIMDAVMPELYNTRWKRKNRIAQLKRSITRYKDATNLPKYSHELRAYKLLQLLKKPGKKATMFDWTSYIHRLQEITFQMERALVGACISAGRHLERREKHEATQKPPKNGQQTDLPPTGGQQACNAQNAENAKQAGLPCAGAEQQTAGKEQE